MRITRFLNERGEEHLGVDRGDRTAECLQGSVYAAAGRRPGGAWSATRGRRRSEAPPGR